LAALSVILLPAAMAAANPLGIGAGEAALPATGFLSGLMAWINAMQQDFYRALTGALRSLREGEGGLPVLVGLSFAYGVFHAAGPGHGKAVISSYMLANEVALRRGILLSFLSAFLQGLVAIALIGALFLFLKDSSVSMRDAGQFLERTSYALVAAFGAFLLWRKLRELRPAARPASLSAAQARVHGHAHHGPGASCSACGHSHAPDPRLLEGARMDLR